MKDLLVKIGTAIAAAVTAVTGLFSTGTKEVPESPPKEISVQKEEVAKETVPPPLLSRRIDTDKDGIPDIVEIKRYGTDPQKADTDGDGFSDAQEIKAGFDPKSREPIRLP